MSRNASGTYALPAGNPVVSGTFIESAWANSTMGDIETELTDSLSRSGKGGMLAALRITDGTIGAPGLGFTDEAALGLYRSAANTLDFVQGAARKMRVSATQILVNPTAGIADFQVISANNGAKVRIKSGNSTADEGTVELSLTGDVLTFRVVDDDGTAGQTIFSVDLADDEPVVFGRGITLPSGAVAANPMTTAEDIIVGGASGVPTRLALGAADGMVLGRIAGVLGYITVAGWEAVEYADLTNGGANNLANYDLTHVPEDGYIYKLISKNVSGTVDNWSINCRLRTLAGTWLTGTDYYNTNWVIGTTHLATNSTAIIPYTFSGWGGHLAVEAFNFEFVIFDLMKNAATRIWSRSTQYGNTGNVNVGHGGSRTLASAQHDKIRLYVSVGAWDSGEVFLYRIKEPVP